MPWYVSLLSYNLFCIKKAVGNIPSQVNYTNRNAESSISESQLGLAYASATFSALGTAFGLKKLLEKNAPKMLQRFVPLCAVGAANCVSEMNFS